ALSRDDTGTVLPKHGTPRALSFFVDCLLILHERYISHASRPGILGHSTALGVRCRPPWRPQRPATYSRNHTGHGNFEAGGQGKQEEGCIHLNNVRLAQPTDSY